MINLFTATSSLQRNAFLRTAAIGSWVLVVVAHIVYFIFNTTLEYSELIVPCTSALGFSGSCNAWQISPAEVAVLSGLLAFVYFGLVTVLQTIFHSLSSQESPFIVIISTLLIAALFNPLRSRIQAFIDRRFYRRKYDAAQTLARFAATARNEVDVERLSAALVGVVEETIQPNKTILWLNERKEFRNV